MFPRLFLYCKVNNIQIVMKLLLIKLNQFYMTILFFKHLHEVKTLFHLPLLTAKSIQKCLLKYEGYHPSCKL